MSGNVTLNNFANFLSSTYGVEIFQKVNGAWDFTTKGTGWAMIFG
ncbi:hypothetical protein [Spiroplasma poulsonii]|nr:hypothetical protein [Spiroplasma poulsonii]